MPTQDQSGNQSQVSSDSQTDVNTGSSQPSPQSVEATPKPEPSYGIEEFSESHPNLEQGIQPLPRPDPSFETHMRCKFSKTGEKPDK